MSRQPINASALWDSTNHVMDTMTILDPSRLRIPFGKCAKASLASEASEPYEDVEGSDNVLVDVAGLLKPASAVPKESRKVGVQFEVQAWALSLGYALFAFALALGTLLTTQFSGRVCVGMCPLPLVCFLLQAATSPPSAGMALVVCALLLPAVCSFESIMLAACFMLVLAFAMLMHCRQRRGVLVYVFFTGTVFSVLLTLPFPSLEPRWGMATGVFFLSLLCAVSCEKTSVRVWI